MYLRDVKTGEAVFAAPWQLENLRNGEVVSEYAFGGAYKIKRISDLQFEIIEPGYLSGKRYDIQKNQGCWVVFALGLFILACVAQSC